MPAAYSLDLYQKVMNAIDKGMSITTASKTFCISRNTIHLRRKPLQEQGSLEALTVYHNPHDRQIGHNRSWVVNTNVLGRALKKLGWTKK